MFQPRPIRLLRNLGRSREIATVLLQYGFGDVVDRLGLARYLQWGRRVFFWRRVEPAPKKTRGLRMRLALERLGATFIKFGQVMSTRPDLLPPDIIAELSKLQERVPPFPSETAIRVLEDELGAPLERLFLSFEREPIAAGSLAQVHRAQHRDGMPLAVKIRRPGVEREVERDLQLMMELAVLIQRHIAEAEMFDPVGQVSYFARTIRREMNFQREARTMQEFARLFRNDATLVVPAVYDELTTEAVLTMRYVEGYRVDDPDGLWRAGVTGAQVAANGAQIFMKQAFELGLFHGDPHPGNIRVMPDGALCLLDYGMVGVLDDETRDKLVDLLLAVTRRDIRGTVDLILRIGRPVRPVDQQLLRADIRDFVETYYEVSLEQLKVGSMLHDFVATLARYQIRCPPDLMLLIRALVTLEGVGRALDPQFSMPEHLAPFVERLVRQRYSLWNVTGRVVSEVQTLCRLAHEIPQHVGRTLEKLSHDDLKIRFEHGGLEHLITELDRSGNRIVISLVMASLIVASALIIQSGQATLWASLPVFLLSSLLGIWLIYGVFRSGRL